VKAKQLAIVATKAADAAKVVMNSRTHPVEFAQFTRLCQNRKRFPVDVIDLKVHDKTELFQLWLGALDRGCSVPLCRGFLAVSLPENTGALISKVTVPKTLWAVPSSF
jgi:hypothetical protein